MAANYLVANHIPGILPNAREPHVWTLAGQIVVHPPGEVAHVREADEAHDESPDVPLDNALWNKSNGSYEIKDFGPLPLIFSTSKYFRWKFQPCPSFFCMQIFQINEKGVS